jgi:HPr kinase/phosphorylase
MQEKLIHATCVAIAGRGALLLGPSGSGKSDLALRMIDGGARLVADDQVAIVADGQTLIASAPDQISGLLEVRGLGIMALESIASVTLSLVVKLVTPDRVERLPETATWQCLGIDLPMIKLTPFEHSTPAKLRLAVSAPNMNDGAMTDETHGPEQ